MKQLITIKIETLVSEDKILDYIKARIEGPIFLEIEDIEVVGKDKTIKLSDKAKEVNKGSGQVGNESPSHT